MKVTGVLPDMIDLVEWKLRNAGIRTVKLVGSMPVTERESVLNAFRDTESEKQVSVILMSLKAGGEGLNLQVWTCFSSKRKVWVLTRRSF